MSRVDDIDTERRAEEIRQAELKAEDQKQKRRAAEETAFDRALADRAGARVGQALADKAQKSARETQRARFWQAVGSETRDGEGRSAEKRAGAAASSQKAQAELLKDRRSAAAAATPQQPAAPKQKPAGQTPAKVANEAPRSSKEDGKSEEARKQALAGGHKRVGGAEDRDGEGGKRSGGDSKDGQQTSFKLPPQALMAPPPLARPREASDPRMAAFAKEIVDKIVSRVMVGTNERGLPEFRIELRQNVLGGLAVRVSVSGGRGGRRIRAVFSGGDKEALSSLKRSLGSLAKALTDRGLTPEELSVEETPAR